MLEMSVSPLHVNRDALQLSSCEWRCCSALCMREMLLSPLHVNRDAIYAPHGIYMHLVRVRYRIYMHLVRVRHRSSLHVNRDAPRLSECE
jgi:hypothetical protein